MSTNPYDVFAAVRRGVKEHGQHASDLRAELDAIAQRIREMRAAEVQDAESTDRRA
jgi:hypothetical protein